jgi:Uma2 family endonuclease
MLDIDLIAPEVPHRLSRAEYDAIVATGVLDDERVELLQGIMVDMSPNDPPHASPVDLLTEILVPVLVGRARVRIQLPIIATDDSEPEPDVAVVPAADYSREHPGSAFLIIEVADSSLRKDRLVKGPLYARSGFQEYWLMNVRTREVEVHRGPSGDGWKSVTRHGAEETLHPLAFPDVAVSIGEVLR